MKKTCINLAKGLLYIMLIGCAVLDIYCYLKELDSLYAATGEETSS